MLPVVLGIADAIASMAAMEKQTSRNFHVPLPAALHDLLRREAERRRLSATMLAGSVIHQWAERVQAEQLQADISEYARRHAGTTAALDAGLEAAGIEALIERPPINNSGRRTRRK